MAVIHCGEAKDRGFDKDLTAFGACLEEIVPYNPTDIILGYFRLAEQVIKQLNITNLRIGSSELVLCRGWGLPHWSPDLTLSGNPIIPFGRLCLGGLDLAEARENAIRFLPKAEFPWSHRWRKFFGLHVVIKHGQRNKSGWSRGHDFENWERVNNPIEALDTMFKQKWSSGVHLDHVRLRRILEDEADPNGALIHTYVNLNYDTIYRDPPQYVKNGSAFKITADWDQVLFYRTLNRTNESKALEM